MSGNTRLCLVSRGGTSRVDFSSQSLISSLGVGKSSARIQVPENKTKEKKVDLEKKIEFVFKKLAVFPGNGAKFGVHFLWWSQINS